MKKLIFKSRRFQGRQETNLQQYTLSHCSPAFTNSLFKQMEKIARQSQKRSELNLTDGLTSLL